MSCPQLVPIAIGDEHFNVLFETLYNFRTILWRCRAIRGLEYTKRRVFSLFWATLYAGYLINHIYVVDEVCDLKISDKYRLRVKQTIQ